VAQLFPKVWLDPEAERHALQLAAPARDHVTTCAGY
jgi:hypothetical protein